MTCESAQGQTWAGPGSGWREAQALMASLPLGEAPLSLHLCLDVPRGGRGLGVFRVFPLDQTSRFVLAGSKTEPHRTELNQANGTPPLFRVQARSVELLLSISHIRGATFWFSFGAS